MKNIMLKLKYDGTNYVGWQKQPNGATIQGEIEARLSALCGENITVIGCSRTDSGVHAREYVCNFSTNSLLQPYAIKRALNAKLPHDIVVLSAEYVADDFNSRYTVQSKTYVYQILNCEERDPFLGKYAYHVKQPLDVESMNLASKHFIGTYDFRAFTTAEGSEKNTTRTITDCCAERADNLVTIIVTGESFLHNMVRIIAGTIIKVGQGGILADEIPRIIESGERTLAGATAPAKGLFLSEVTI